MSALNGASWHHAGTISTLNHNTDYLGKNCTSPLSFNDFTIKKRKLPKQDIELKLSVDVGVDANEVTR